MKLTTTVTIPASDLSGGASQCHNLRLSRGALTPVGVPAAVCRDAGHPLAVISQGSGPRTLLTARGAALCAVAGGEATQVALLPQAPLCAAEVARGAVVMLEGGSQPVAATRTDSGRWQCAQTRCQYEPLLLIRHDYETLTELVPGRELSDSYQGRSDRLGPADTEALSSEMSRAYAAICDRAAWHRRLVQPVLARYRLLGDGGATLYESAPKLIAPASGVQCAGAQTSVLLSGTTATIKPLALTAVTYGVRLLLPQEPSEQWLRDVRAVQVLVSPQIHPWSPEARSLSSISGLSAGSGTLEVRVPGLPLTDTPVCGPGSDYRNRLTGALARLDDLLGVAATLDADASAASAAEIQAEAYNGRWADTAAQVSGLRRVLARGAAMPGADVSLLRSLQPPHSFAASCVGRSGDVLAWGGLWRRRFQGYPIMEMAAESERVSEAQPTAAVVEFGTQASVVSALTEHGSTTGRLSPLLVYPDPEATHMELLWPGRRQRLPLQSSQDGAWAYWLSDTCQPFVPDQTSEPFDVPAASSEPVPLPDAVAFCRAHRPLLPLCAARCAGTVTAVTPASRSASAWDFARAHFYAFTTAGTHTLAVNARRDSASASLIDARAVVRADAVAVTSAGVAALASGDLMVVSGSSARTLPVDVSDAAMLGWCEKRGELWALSADSHATVCSVARGCALFTRSDVEVSSLLSHAGSLYLLDASGTLRQASTEGQPDAGAECRFQMRVPVSSGFRARVAEWRVYGSSLRATLSVKADTGQGLPYATTVVAHTVDGSLNAPLRCRIAAPSRPYLSACVHGCLGADSSIEQLTLEN